MSLAVERLREGISGGRWLVAVAVSVLLIGGLVWFAPPRELWRVVSGAHAGWLVAAAGLYAGVLAARWVRLAGLVDVDRLSAHRLELLWASAGHSFATQLLPVRSGELAFPVLWRRATGESLARGTVYLTAIRVVELGIVVPLYALGLGVWLSGEGIADGGWIVWGLGGFGMALLVGLPWLLRVALRIARWVLEQTALRRVEALEPLREAVPQAAEAVAGLGPGRRLWLVATSLVMWGLMFGVFAATLAACGLDLSLAQIVVGSGGGIVGNLAPVGGIGSVGTMEAGWTAAFEATGAPTAPIVAAGMLVHVLVIAGTGLATAVGWGVGKLLNRG